MRARRLIVALAVALLAAPLAAEARQPAGRVAKIGLLLTGSPSVTRHYTEALRLGLHHLEYVESQNVAFEARWAEGGKPEEFRGLAAELAGANVSLIFALGTTATAAAKQATATIPIVFVAVGDPVGSSLVASLSRPGGNVTGQTNISAELSAKLLELLREVAPQANPVAVLRNPANPVSVPQLRWTEVAARTLQVELQVVEARAPHELDDAFAAIARRGARALIVLPDPMFLSQRSRIAELAVRAQLAAAFNWRDYAEAGGLLSYGPNLLDQIRRSASMIDKILRGAKPADLPVEQPTKFELVINMKTAKALGLTIPPSVLVRADQIID